MVREKVAPGPRVWADLNTKADSKIESYLEKNEERTAWLTTYLEDCRKKLSGASNNPSFVNKPPRAPLNKRSRVGRKSEIKEKDIEKSRRSSRKKSSLTMSTDQKNDNKVEVEKEDEIVYAKSSKRSSKKTSVSRCNDQNDLISDIESGGSSRIKSSLSQDADQMKDLDNISVAVEGKGVTVEKMVTTINSSATSRNMSSVENMDEDMEVDTADIIIPIDSNSTGNDRSEDNDSSDGCRVADATFDVSQAVHYIANKQDSLGPGFSSDTTESLDFIEADIVVQNQEEKEQVTEQVNFEEEVTDAEAVDKLATEQQVTEPENTKRDDFDENSNDGPSSISRTATKTSPEETVTMEKSPAIDATNFSNGGETFDENDVETRKTTNESTSIVDVVETSNYEDMTDEKNPLQYSEDSSVSKKHVLHDENDVEPSKTTIEPTSIVDVAETFNYEDMTDKKNSLQYSEDNLASKKPVIVEELSRSKEDVSVTRDDQNIKEDENVDNSKDVDEEENNTRSSKTQQEISVSTTCDSEEVRPKRSTRTKPKKLAPESDSNMTVKILSLASPRVKELVKTMSPSVTTSPTMNPIFIGSPIKDRVKVYEEAVRDSAGLGRISSSKFKTASSKTPRSIRRKSSVAKSLMKVSAAKGVHMFEILAKQQVNVVVGKDSALKSPGERQSLNNSRAPAGKVVRPGRKVYASGGRGITTPGSSSGSSSIIRNRSRLNLGTPSNGSRNEAQKDEERRKQTEKENEAKQRREDMLKSKTEKQRESREARSKRVQEARKKQENQNSDNARRNKEKVDKLAILKKREENFKDQAKKKKEAEVKQREAELRLKEEEEEKQVEEKRLEKIKQRKEEEEKKQTKLNEQEARKAQLTRKALEDEEQKIAQQERIRREKEELNNIKKSPALRQVDLDTTDSKENSLNKTQILDSSSSKACQGVTSYDMTPARHELPPEPLKNEDDYGLEDLHSDQDTDDEEAPRKQIPKWADSTGLRTALFKQCYMGPNVDEIFMTIIMPDLSEMFKQQRKRFFKRTSSACWDQAPASFKVTR